jgi:hypothetical protein
MAVQKFDHDDATVKGQLRMAERLEHFCAIDKLGESWNSEIELIENNSLEVGERRSIDLGDHVLQVLANALKPKVYKSG